MDINQFIRIILRHIWLLISIPLILALIVIYLTRHPKFEYESNTRIYTGLASGADLQQTEGYSYMAANNAFDNLINVIQSRETLTEVSLRLLAQGLILEHYEPTYISKESFIELRTIVPPAVKDLVVKPLIPNDSLSFAMAMDKTVENFMAFKNKSDTNFLYDILNYNHKFYSIKALSRVNVKRIQNSDMIEITYKCEDPGIALQTLKILTQVFISNYKNLKENISDVVVAYFEKRVDEAQTRLKGAEDELLEFTTSNNIINYNEQTKFIASKKEDIEEYIQNEKMNLRGAEEALKNIESRMQVQGQVQTVSQDILDKRDRLVNMTEKITINELYNENDTVSKNKLAELRAQASALENEIQHDLNQLYSYRNTIEGLPVSDLLNEWLTNSVKYAEAKAGLQVLEARQKEFMRNYEVYAPLGSKMKRIEREINVAEQEYLSLLHSLNMAKLEQQNQSIGTNIKPVDAPYFPLSPQPTKRKILVLAAGFLGFILVLFAILAAEYFDNTIRTTERARKLTGLEPIGVFPRFIGKYRAYNLSFILTRLTELCVQEIKSILNTKDDPLAEHKVKYIVMTSTQEVEGKTFVAKKLVNKLRSMGEQVLYLNYTFDSPESFRTGAGEEAAEKQQKSGGLFASRKKSHRQQDELERLTMNRDNLLYQVDDYFAEKLEVLELVPDQQVNTLDNYDYVMIEMPSILFYTYPAEIVRSADLSIISTRANREWKKADQGAVDLYSNMTGKKPVLVLNATDINEIETKLGTLPKRRSRIRRGLKQLVNLQFYTKRSIR